jgi:hypothetical protein
VLVRLPKALELTEVYISAGDAAVQGTASPAGRQYKVRAGIAG